MTVVFPAAVDSPLAVYVVVAVDPIVVGATGVIGAAVGDSSGYTVGRRLGTQGLTEAGWIVVRVTAEDTAAALERRVAAARARRL